MSLFFYLFTLAINLWHQKFVIEDVTAVFVNNKHDIKRRGQDFEEFLKSATDFVLPIVRRIDREHLFVRKENKVSGILREHLKQKLSALHASSAVRVCQLRCTFHMQVFTNNLGHRRPMNTRLQ